MTFFWDIWQYMAIFLGIWPHQKRMKCQRFKTNMDKTFKKMKMKMIVSNEGQSKVCVMWSDMI